MPEFATKSLGWRLGDLVDWVAGTIVEEASEQNVEQHRTCLTGHGASKGPALQRVRPPPACFSGYPTQTSRPLKPSGLSYRPTGRTDESR